MSPGPSGPCHGTATTVPPITSVGAVTLTSAAATRQARVERTQPPEPARYLTSYSPWSTGAVSRAGLPKLVNVYESITAWSAPTGATVTMSPGLSGPSQATSNAVPPATSSGACRLAPTARAVKGAL